MAKSISVLDALAVLKDSGISFGEEHAEAIAELTRATFMTAAVEIIAGNGKNLPGKLADDAETSSEDWASNLFDLAETLRNEFTGEVKSVQGGAVRMVRTLGIDTPNGHLSIQLKSMVPAEVEEEEAPKKK